LDPFSDLPGQKRIKVQPGNGMPHRDDQHRDRQYERDPKLARERVDFALLLFIPRRSRHWLKSHAAYWAMSRVVLLNLRMHRAGIDHLVLFAENRISLQCHAALGTTARLVSLQAFTHRAEVFLF